MTHVACAPLGIHVSFGLISDFLWTGSPGFVRSLCLHGDFLEFSCFFSFVIVCLTLRHLELRHWADASDAAFGSCLRPLTRQRWDARSSVGRVPSTHSVSFAQCRLQQSDISALDILGPRAFCPTTVGRHYLIWRLLSVHSVFFASPSLSVRQSGMRLRFGLILNSLWTGSPGLVRSLGLHRLDVAFGLPSGLLTR